MITKVRKQIRWTFPLGNEPIGSERLARWKEAALKVFPGNPRFFNAWMRQVLDGEAARLLKK